MDFNKILVSVLMTSFNRENYIGEAIESVLASTYTTFELIICDDCSKDRTVEIAKSYAVKDARIKVHINEKNLGDYPNRNKAASYATGKYLKYVDADDYIYPWGLEILVQMMEKFPNAGWGICSLDQIKEKPFPFELTPKQAYEFHYLGKGIFQRSPLSSILNRKIFEEAGGFAHIRMAGDFEMWHRLGQKYNVVLMPKGIVWYREHAQQEMKDFHNYQSTYEDIRLKYLRDENSPIEKNVIKEIYKKNRKWYIKLVITDLIKFRLTNLKFNFTALLNNR